jgi:hypothetical protein
MLTRLPVFIGQPVSVFLLAGLAVRSDWLIRLSSNCQIKLCLLIGSSISVFWLASQLLYSGPLGSGWYGFSLGRKIINHCHVKSISSSGSFSFGK